MISNEKVMNYNFGFGCFFIWDHLYNLTKLNFKIWALQIEGLYMISNKKIIEIYNFDIKFVFVQLHFFKNMIIVLRHGYQHRITQ